MTDTASGVNTTGDQRREGGCEVDGCRAYAMVFVNGRRLLCWDHYAAEAQAAPDRSEPSQTQASP